MSAKEKQPLPTEELAVSGVSDGSLVENELNQFQDGLAFINAVRGDLENQKQLDTDRPNRVTVGFGQADGDEHAANEFPSSIARFDIRRIIGEGGFANVYLAFDPVLNREVAVKVLKVNSTTSDSKTRFDREARVAAVLNHPNIVPVFDAGVIDNKHFIVSKYCQGTSLDQWIEQNHPIDYSLAARIVSTIGSALEYAHQRGIIHRDIKPANVLFESSLDGHAIGTDNFADHLRVTDFGLAKFANDIDQMQTFDGVVLGTPAFMSPEQADGKQVTAASDIYSLGVIMYQLLTGKLPVIGETHVQTIYSIIHEQPVPPSKRRANVPRDLEAICLKCLHKESGKRYSSAFELSEDLNRWLNGEPVVARIATTPERMLKWCRRNPVLTSAFAATLFALCFALFQLKNANANYEQAVSESEKANRNIQLAQDTTKDMVARISRSSSIPIEIRKELVIRAVQLQNQLLKDDPADRRIVYETAESYLTLSQLHEGMRDFDLSLDAVERAISLVETTPPRDDKSNEKQSAYRIRMQKAEVLLLVGRTDEALACIDVAKPDRKDPMQLAAKLQKESLILQGEGNLNEAWLKLDESRFALTAAGNNIFAKGQLVHTLQRLGYLEQLMGRSNEAAHTYWNAINLFNEVAEVMPYHESLENAVASAYHSVGAIESELGNRKQANLALEMSAEIYDRLVEYNKLKPVFIEGAVDVGLERFDMTLGDSQDEAIKLLEKLTSDFKLLPDPVPADEISSAKTARDNETKQRLAVEISKRQIQMAQKMELLDGDRGKPFLDQAKELTLYLRSHFPECDEIDVLDEQINR